MMTRKFLRGIPIACCVLVLFGIAAAQDDSDQGDAVLRALVDEMDRSLSLKLEGLETPYFVQYTVDDTKTWRISATCGAIVTSDDSHSRRLQSQIRVGSYELDNTNFAGGGGGGMFGRGGGGGRGRPQFGGGGATPLPVEDDYATIRQAIWLATDGLYKSAVETLADKRAYLADRADEDRLPDFAKVEPVMALGSKATLEFDTGDWESKLRKISAVFLEQAEIQSSSVSLSANAGTRYLVNSEGSRQRNGSTSVSLAISVNAQAEDGTRLSDRRTWLAETPAGLPGLNEILADAKHLATALVETVRAPVLEDYTGPVLFDGPAAAQMFQRMLASGMVARPESVGGGRRRFAGSESLEKYLKKRILPKSFQAWDDPSTKSHGDQVLAGHYQFDEEGVPAQRVDLITNGSFRAMLSSRTPTPNSATSNGHARRGGRGGGAGIANLFIESKDGLSPDELKQALIEAAKEQDLEYAIRVTSLRAGGFGGGGGRAAMMDAMRRRGGGMRGGGQGGGSLGDPIHITKVYVEDGREERVRGCEFGEVDVRDLKDIIAAGKSAIVHNQGAGGGGTSVIAPAVILEEVDLYTIEEEPQRKPVVPAPHARSK